MKLVKKYYFDTNALVKYYKASVDYYGNGKGSEQEKGCEQVVNLVKTARPILISPLTLVETIGCFTKLFRKGSGVKTTVRRREELYGIIELLKGDIGENDTIRPFKMIPVPDGFFTLAESILIENADSNIQTNDALHLAIAKKLESSLESPIVMVTSDNSMKNVCGLMRLESYDSEIEV
jgi:predicted nucleic acid-binding protein